MTPLKDEDARLLSSEGWNRPGTGFHKSLTVMVNLDENMDVIKNRLKRKWNYNLRRSDTFKHRFDILNDDNQLSVFIEEHGKMRGIKGFKDNFDLKELKIMKEKLKDDLFVFTTYENNTFSSGRIMARFMNTACELKAVTTERGRKTRASYFCLWEAIKFLKAKGCKRLDMGGVDPEENPGVTLFKRGVGGEDIRWLGEWEKSNNKLFGKLINRLL